MNVLPRLADNVGRVIDLQAIDTRVPFTGRAYELRVLLAFFKRGGALTLVGPGGVGKSRLAHEALSRFARDQAIEAIFVPLAGVAPEAVLGTVMNHFGIAQEPGHAPLETLVTRMRERRAVVVLDNCEHAPDETSALIDALSPIPQLTLIATSQRRLDYSDEEVIELEPFTIADAVAFFAARAGLSQPLDDEMQATIATIAARLDGLAIALDLAAARLTSLSLDQLAAELAELRPYHLRSTRGSEPRHRTIGNVIAWSHSQLSEEAKHAFAQASFFCDAFDAEDLAALGNLEAQDAQSALDELARNSLIVTTEFGYRMLHPIRAVAIRMLAEERNRRTLDEMFAQRINANAARAHYGDLCAALAWALKRPQERLAEIDAVLGAAMAVWVEGGRFTEGLLWAERLEGVVQRVPSKLRGRIYYLGLCVAHAAAKYQHMLERGPLTISAFTIAGDQLGLARAYNALAVASFNTGAIEGAAGYVETALRFYEQLQHTAGIATALINQGNVLFEGYGDYARAHAVFRKALAVLEAGSAPRMLCGTALGDLAEVEYAMAEYDSAEERARSAIEHFEAQPSAPMIAWQYETLARCSLARGRLTAATEQLAFAADLLRRTPQALYLARLAELIGRRLLRGGRPQAAARALAGARRFRRERALVSLGIFANAVREDEEALARELEPQELAEAAEAVAGWDLGRFCSILAGLLMV